MGIKKIIVVAIFAIAIIYADYSLVINAQIKSIKLLDPKIIKLKNDLVLAEKNIVNMQQLKDKQKESVNKALKVHKFIRESELPDLMQNIVNLAKSCNVDVEQMRPIKETLQQPLPSKNDLKNAPVAKTDSLLINLDLVCGYHNLGRFISQLENAQDLIIVQNIKIEPQGLNYLKQKTSLTLRAYTQK